MRKTVLLTLCLLATLPSAPQQPASPAPTHTFEVVSIRLSGKDSNHGFWFTQDSFHATR